MNSNWLAKSWAVFQKEWRSEMRSKHGLYTSILFSLLAVIAMSFAAFGSPPKPDIAAGMLSVTFLFSAVVALPRTFLAEDENNTFDMIRLAAEPSVLYFGKLMYNGVQSLLSCLVLGVVFVGVTGTSVRDPLLFASACVLTSTCVAGGVSLCGAIVIGSDNRWLLGTAAAVPVMLPQIFLGMGALRTSFGSGMATNGWSAAIGLAGWSLVLWSAGPVLAPSAWKTDNSIG